jgi:hypothetical protein
MPDQLLLQQLLLLSYGSRNAALPPPVAGIRQRQRDEAEKHDGEGDPDNGEA